MPRKQSWYEENVQPMNWHRAFLSGVCGSLIMMAFIDTFYMMGATPFCFENYLGNLITGHVYGAHIWTIGLIANLVLGGVIGFFYGFFFEYVFKRADARNGLKVGFYHAILAAVAIFPFLKVIEDQTLAELYPHFGFFGSGLGPVTPLVLLFGHLIFGATMGTFYGPVRMERVYAKYMEPEDTVYEESFYRRNESRNDHAA